MSDDTEEYEEYEEGYDQEPAAPAASAEVRIEGPGVQIIRSVDEKTMASIIALLFRAVPGMAAGPGSPTDSHVQTATVVQGRGRPVWDKDLTLGEFLHETEAKTFPHKICATGYYLMEFRGVEYFNRDEVKAALVESREDLPQNYSRDWSLAISSNLIAPQPGEADKFYVTRTGNRAVDSKFQDVPKRRANRRTSRRVSGGSNGKAE